MLLTPCVATNGVVVATERKLPSPLVVGNTVEKVSALDRHVGVVYSGMGPDARVLVVRVCRSALRVDVRTLIPRAPCHA
jgi:20S proteasome subunit alpha 2